MPPIMLQMVSSNSARDPDRASLDDWQGLYIWPIVTLCVKKNCGNCSLFPCTGIRIGLESDFALICRLKLILYSESAQSCIKDGTVK